MAAFPSLFQHFLYVQNVVFLFYVLLLQNIILDEQTEIARRHKNNNNDDYFHPLHNWDSKINIINQKYGHCFMYQRNENPKYCLNNTPNRRTMFKRINDYTA